MVEIMARGERKIARLIDDLLDLGRIRVWSAGARVVVLRSVRCHTRRQHVDGGADASTPDRRLNLELDGPVVGRWDRARLDQVVSNLLANAVKYGQGRPVVIRAGADRAARASPGWR